MRRGACGPEWTGGARHGPTESRSTNGYGPHRAGRREVGGGRPEWEYPLAMMPPPPPPGYCFRRKTFVYLKPASNFRPL